MPSASSPGETNSVPGGMNPNLESVDTSHLGAFLPHSHCSSPVFLANSAYSLRKPSLISTNATKKSPSKHSCPQTLKGIIFDLDGTLVDSEPFHLAAWNEIVLAHAGTPIPGWNDDTVGHPDSVAAEKALRLYPELAGQTVPGLTEEKYRIFRDFVRREGPRLLFPGVEEALRRARAAGLPLAVGTNSTDENAFATLDAAGITDFFAAVVTIDRVARGKPEPDIYALAAAELGLPPENCAVIEDSAAGARAGGAAGCVVLAVGPAARAGARRGFAGLAEAVEWILGGSGF